MKPFWRCFFLLWAVLSLQLAATASATAAVVASSVGGTASLDWSTFQHSGVDRDIEGTNFFQQYSLVYRSKGSINNYRAGKWSAAIGYEWSGLSSELGDESFDETAGKILYSGDLLFAPGGLPLRLHVYSHDMVSARPVEELGSADTGFLSTTGIYTTIHNGQSITTGMTLIAGIKNGSYQGHYRDLLSRFPKLFVDYRENLVKDTHRLNPVDYRLRDLAFVSLNKKDNWFHFRMQDYKDDIDPSNNYTDRTFLVGTVDHYYRRQWIHLTNWIQLSADLSLEQNEGAGGESTQTDTYRLNLFTRSKRSSLSFDQYTSLSRISRASGVDSLLSVPVFASGTYSPETRWRLFLVGSREKREVFAEGNGDGENREHAYARYQLETQVRRNSTGYLLTPTVELEVNEDSDESGRAGRFGFEYSTDRRYQRPLKWVVTYSLLYAQGDRADGSSGDYLEQDASVSFERRVDSWHKYGGSQRLLIGNGNSNNLATAYIRSRGVGNLAGNAVSADALEDVAFRSDTSVFFELTDRRRLSNRFEANLAFSDVAGEMAELFTLWHVLTWDDRVVNLRMQNIFQQGENATLGGLSLNMATGVSNPDMLFKHTSRLQYSPSRAWKTAVAIGGGWQSGEEGTASGLDFEQKTEYSLWTFGGRQRVLLKAYEEFAYDVAFGGGAYWYSRLKLGADYFPWRVFSVGGNVELEYYDQMGETLLGGEIYLALDYSKLHSKVSYEYKQLEREDLPQTVWDSRLSVSVTKIF